jgi:hypothetical protein
MGCLTFDSDYSYLNGANSISDFIVSNAGMKNEQWIPKNTEGSCRWRIRNNMEIDKSIEGADIVRFIKAQRIKRLGHIQRMDQARPTRKLLNWKPIGTRPVGRPRQRWQEVAMEDLKKLKIKNWKEKAKDRRTWREGLRRWKPTKGCSAKWYNDDDDDDDDRRNL